MELRRCSDEQQANRRESLQKIERLLFQPRLAPQNKEKVSIRERIGSKNIPIVICIENCEVTEIIVNLCFSKKGGVAALNMLGFIP